MCSTPVGERAVRVWRSSNGCVSERGSLLGMMRGVRGSVICALWLLCGAACVSRAPIRAADGGDGDAGVDAGLASVDAGLTCDAGMEACGTSCMDVANDPAHCGSCGTSCPSGASCSQGACTCEGVEQLCPAGCAVLASDPLNCGSCGTSCAAGASCQDGGCACPSNEVVCGDTCVSLSDERHCGTCDNDCGPGARCASGECLSCPVGMAVCNHACVDTQSDVANCGTCGNTCPGEAGQAACNAGGCDLGWWHLQDNPRTVSTNIVYDSRRDVIVLYDGGDIYEWKDGVWGMRVRTLNRPHLSYMVGIAYDSLLGATVITGCSACQDPFLNETWLWDGDRWTQAMTEHSPPARISPFMTYDSARNVIVLWGGAGLDQYGYSEVFMGTWEWDGLDWTERIPDEPEVAPAVRPSGAFIYDTMRHVSILYLRNGDKPMACRHVGMERRRALSLLPPPSGWTLA
jgi:hypothetical protein